MRAPFPVSTSHIAVSAPRLRYLLLGLALVLGTVGAPLTVRAAVLRHTALQEREAERQEQVRERPDRADLRERHERALQHAEARRKREREQARRDRDRERERAERDRDRYDEDDGRGMQTTRIDTTVSVGREPVVDLSLISGDVTVTAGAEGRVQVRGYSERLPLRFEATTNGVRVWVPSQNNRGRSGEQRLAVVVPVGARVTAKTVSGDVSVRGVRGELEAGTVSGDVEAQGGVRRVSLNTVSGSVRASALEGDVRARSVSGDVALTDVTGEIDAESVSGGVEIRNGRSGRVRLQSVSGNLEYAGTFARDGRYEMQTHSGDVRLALPSDLAASLSLRTFSGSIDTALPLTLRPSSRSDGGRGRERSIDATLGTGTGARIIAETFSGSIAIARQGAPR